MLIVPCCDSGKGGGHLTRCMRLTAELRGLNREAWLYLPTEKYGRNNLLQLMNFNQQWVITSDQLSMNHEFIILDRFQTPRQELLHWKKIAPVIGIDEGGPCRDDFDFLIDMLVPENFIEPSANIYSPKLLVKDITRKRRSAEYTEEKKEKSCSITSVIEQLPLKRTCETTNSNRRFAVVEQVQNTNKSKLKILIAFGHEDSAGLGVKITRELLKNKHNGIEITLLRGGLNNSHISSSPNLKIIDMIPNLSDHLSEYDLVITHYGLTAYEAVFAETPVLLAHPTPYHRKLAKSAGFITFNKYMIHRHGVTQKIINKCKESTLKLKFTDDLNLAELVNGFTPQVNRKCPVCGNEKKCKSIARFSNRTYRRCSKCGIIFMDRICPPPVEYEKEYFFEQYKKQYGKTYLEDFENIKNAGKCRLKFITKYLHGGTEVRKRNKTGELPSLLDIGCAYGPFLDAAREEGFSPFGIDPARDAVDYVKEKLNIPAIQGFFPISHSLLHITHFDVITLWYVIEHFRDCIAVLAEIRKLLNPGGILAFSTPSFSGISGRSSLRKFLSASPADHYTVWSPSMCKKALSLAGFKVKKTATNGHHPERFPLFGKFAKNRKSPVYWVLLAISRLFGLGDTFEVYASLV
ncbi:MAG: methyltransferase domain-containing protein [Treponema sp.]|nr:methyltransferase domain-containing protein [Treponema sp.]